MLASETNGCSSRAIIFRLMITKEIVGKLDENIVSRENKDMCFLCNDYAYLHEMRSFMNHKQVGGDR